MTVTAPTPEQLATCYAQVLIPVDFSDLSWRVLPLARAMAKTFGAPRRVLHVDTASPWLDEGAHRLVLKASPQGDPVSVEVLAARTAADGIVRALGDDESSLLVMSTHGHTAAIELAMGSTTDQVLRSWQGPLLVAGPRFRSTQPPIHRIVFCVDYDSAPGPQLMTDVRAWAQTLDVPVDVCNVATAASVTALDALLAERDFLDDIAKELARDGARVEVMRLRGGSAAHELVTYADERLGTLIAMNTRARPAAGRVLLGSVAMSVVRHTVNPVLLRSATTTP